MSEPAIAAAVAALRAGGVVAMPTETVYGLAADAANPAAVARVYAIKGRPADHPLILHGADLAMLEGWIVPHARLAPLAARFWPGPLTVVVARGPRAPLSITGGQATIAVRVPAHPLAQALLGAFGAPLVAPSANRFGRVSPTTAQHVRDDLGDDVDAIVDGGPSAVGVESTIVDLTAAVPAVLRAGAITPAMLADALGEPVRRGSDGRVRVSGALASHYAPRARVVLCEDARRCDEMVAATPGGVALTLPPDPAAAARTLYAALRALDTSGAQTIVVALPPDEEAFAAVRDRLTRAAVPRPDA